MFLSVRGEHSPWRDSRQAACHWRPTRPKGPSEAQIGYSLKVAVAINAPVARISSGRPSGLRSTPGRGGWPTNHDGGTGNASQRMDTGACPSFGTSGRNLYRAGQASEGARRKRVCRGVGYTPQRAKRTPSWSSPVSLAVSGPGESHLSRNFSPTAKIAASAAGQERRRCRVASFSIQQRDADECGP